ncbi:MAG TPA: YitT family protein [Candidatus Olsenella excrementavium]|uniref:YitT family protein n=1 Tax=Candidatus Olsenella excrementavium TaxID=2838709 RepID=A0A9D1ZAM0_9ACTN|nr:YitT family protein [Candidatus Olsenella excrementavium]
MRRELLDFRGESGHRAREEPAVGEKDVQVAEGVEPVAEEMTPDEARRAERLSRRRMAYSFPQFFCLLNLGLILTAVALVLFKTPNHLAFGGTTGFAILLNTALPALPVSVYMWILNAALVLLGLVFLERKAVLWSAFASFALSGYTSLFEWLFPVTASITGDLWLDVCFAVLLPAVGSALVFDIGASTGGTDILAMILRRRTDIEIGKALFAVDVGVVVAAIGLYGARVGLYCVLALIGKTFVVDGFIESIRQRKVCQVICDHPRDVEEFIVKKLGRTATVTFGWGAYSGRRQTILTSVLSRREAMKLRLFVRAQDPGAFITIVSSSEIVGRGFRGVN